MSIKANSDMMALGTGTVTRDWGSVSFSVVRLRFSLILRILSLKKAASSSHVKEVMGAGFMRLSIVEKSTLGLFIFSMMRSEMRS